MLLIDVPRNCSDIDMGVIIEPVAFFLRSVLLMGDSPGLLSALSKYESTLAGSR